MTVMASETGQKDSGENGIKGASVVEEIRVWAKLKV